MSNISATDSAALAFELATVLETQLALQSTNRNMKSVGKNQYMQQFYNFLTDDTPSQYKPQALRTAVGEVTAAVLQLAFSDNQQIARAGETVESRLRAQGINSRYAYGVFEDIEPLALDLQKIQPQYICERATQLTQEMQSVCEQLVAGTLPIEEAVEAISEWETENHLEDLMQQMEALENADGDLFHNQVASKVLKDMPPSTAKFLAEKIKDARLEKQVIYQKVLHRTSRGPLK